jgi:type I restriction-modification system DNA methylase subunit
MLSVSEQYIRDLNSEANPHLFGQDYNDESWAVCKSDMLIKGEDADNIILNDTFTRDGFDRDAAGNRWTFDYMLANPPFGVEWKQQKFVEDEARLLGYNGRFGAGLPRINDGALLFLQHMIAKMRAPEEGGSRIGIVFNGSPLFTGDAGSGESNIVDHRERLARGHRCASRSTLLQHRHLHVHLDPHQSQRAATQRKDPAHRRAPILREDAEEPRQQTEQDRRPDRPR